MRKASAQLGEQVKVFSGKCRYRLNQSPLLVAHKTTEISVLMKKSVILGVALILGYASPALAEYLSLSYTANSGSLAQATNFGTSADTVDFCAFDNVLSPGNCSSVEDVSTRYDNSSTDQYYQPLRPVIGMVRAAVGGQFSLFDAFAVRYGVLGGLMTLKANNGETYLDGTTALYGGELELALEEGPIQVLGFYPYGKVAKVNSPEFDVFLVGENSVGGQRYTRKSGLYDGAVYLFGGSYIIQSSSRNSQFHFDLFKELSEGQLRVGDYKFNLKNYNIGFALKYTSKM